MKKFAWIIAASAFLAAALFVVDDTPPGWWRSQIASIKLAWQFKTTTPIFRGTAGAIEGQKIIRGLPAHGQPFTMAVEPEDPIGSIYDCFDRVHQAGGGYCAVEPQSITGGAPSPHNEYNQLHRRYQDTSIVVPGINDPN